MNDNVLARDLREYVRKMIIRPPDNPHFMKSRYGHPILKYETIGDMPWLIKVDGRWFIVDIGTHKDGALYLHWPMEVCKV